MSITRSITRPIVRGITRGIVRGDLDADAAAYIAAVETALSSSISADQKNAINTFFKTGKSEGWYSSLKRLYLPIWADAAANAIDMVTLTSGTFSASGVTHATGYVQGDGVAGYFDTGTLANSLGLTNASAGLFCLIPTAATTAACHIGAFNSATSYLALLNTTTQYRSILVDAARQQLVAATLSTIRGIIIIDRDGGDDVIYSRKDAGFSEIVRTTQAASGTLPPRSFYAMALNQSGTATAISNATYGAYGVTDNIADASGFSLALKDLWETASGLTLP